MIPLLFSLIFTYYRRQLARNIYICNKRVISLFLSLSAETSLSCVKQKQESSMIGIVI